MTIYHIHHIVPKHAGGTDDPSNLIKVTISEHAAFHYERWVYLGNDKDKLAWLGLIEVLKTSDIVHTLQVSSGKRSGEIHRQKLLSDKKYKEKCILSFVQNMKNGHTKEVKNRRIQSQKNTFKRINHQKGSKNSMYGMKWIFNIELKTSKRIPKNVQVPTGWKEGRKIKF